MPIRAFPNRDARLRSTSRSHDRRRPQIASSAHFLLQSIQQEWAWESDPVEVKEVLTAMRPPANQTEPAALIDLPNSTPMWRSVCSLQICRYVTHEHLSKHSAISILRCKVPSAQGREAPADLTTARNGSGGGATRASRAVTIRETIGNSHRTSSQWLLTYADYLQTDEFDAEHWKTYAQAERAQWTEKQEHDHQRKRSQTLPLICKQLIEHQKREIATEVAESMIELLPKNSIVHFRRLHLGTRQ